MEWQQAGGGDHPALRKVKTSCLRVFAVVALFSFCTNALMLTMPLYMMQIYDRVMTTRIVDTLLMLTVIAAVALLVLYGLDVVRNRVMTSLGIWIDRTLAGRVLAGAVDQAVRTGASSGAQALRDLGTVRTFIAGPSLFPLFEAPWVPIFLAFIFLMHPLLGAVATLGSVLLLVLAVLNDTFTRAPLREANAVSVASLAAADAAVRNADVIVAMGMLPGLVRRWYDEGEPAVDLQDGASRRAGMLTALARFVRLGMQIAILGVGAWLAIDHKITAGVVAAASIIMSRAVAPIEQVIPTWRGLVAAQSAYRRLDVLLAGTAVPGLGMTLPAPDGRITVEELSYVAPGSQQPILRNLNFALAPGEALGLIGPTAAGKTTLARLMVGALQPTRGHVRLGGADIAVWDSNDRGRHVGYLPQDIDLFQGTVRDNIARLGSGDDAAIVEAAMLAGVHEMILGLPQGYDTRIGGPGGLRLSGGQRQRIGLARAVFGNPRFVVLDEPNSNLDAVGEQALLNALNALKARGATVVLIAHRPNMVANMDRILVLRAGAVDLFGPRDEVLARLARSAAAAQGEAATPLRPVSR